MLVVVLVESKFRMAVDRARDDSWFRGWRRVWTLEKCEHVRGTWGWNLGGGTLNLRLRSPPVPLCPRPHDDVRANLQSGGRQLASARETTREPECTLQERGFDS